MLNNRFKDIQSYKFIEKLKSFPFIDEIWLFGSRARGDNQERSDIDLAIVCPNATKDDWFKVLRVIEEPDTLLKVDCIRYDSLNENDAIKHNILRFKKVLYKREEKMEIVWKDYFNTLGEAIDRLREVINDSDVMDENNYMRDAAIQRFEFVIELFWKLLKKVLFHENIESDFPRDVLSKAYQFNLINNEDMWIKMLEEEKEKIIFENIKAYLPVFESTYAALKAKYKI